MNIIEVLGTDGRIHLDDAELAQTLCGIDLTLPGCDMWADAEGSWADPLKRCPRCAAVWERRN